MDKASFVFNTLAFTWDLCNIQVARCQMHQIICNIIPHNWSCRSCLLQLNSLPSDSPPLSMLAACCFRLAQYNALALSSREGQKISLAFSLPPSPSFPYVVITINHRHYKDKSHPSSLPSILPFAPGSTVHCTYIHHQGVCMTRSVHGAGYACLQELAP